MAQKINDPSIQRVFKQLQSRAGVSRTRLVIEKKPKINAMTNMFTHTIHLTTRDLQVLNLDDIRALLGHELGHLHDQHKSDYWISLVILFLMALALSSINFSVSNLWLQTLINIVQIVVELIILLAITSPYSRFEEKRADHFSAKLVGADKNIHLLKRIHNYHVREIRQAQAMTKELTTVPTAYLECQMLLLWHRLIMWISQHNLGVHPSYQTRIQLLKRIKK